MQKDVFNLDAMPAGTIDIADTIWSAPVNVALMHQAYIRQMAGLRAGTASTKTRSEVSGGGKKPWKQKGTGRARQGSTRAPQWVGGGIIFGPKPRDYSIDMPKSARRAAIRSALSARLSDDVVKFTIDWAPEKPSTKTAIGVISKFAHNGKVLIVDGNRENNNLLLSIRNIPTAKRIFAGNLNIKDLLEADRILFTKSAATLVEEIFN